MNRNKQPKETKNNEANTEADMIIEQIFSAPVPEFLQEMTDEELFEYNRKYGDFPCLVPPDRVLH